MSTDLDLLCISAMSGQFAGQDNLDQLWAAILQARPAALTDLPSRWGIPSERFVAATPGTRNRSYLDKAFCLDAALANPGDFAWRLQRNLAIRVCGSLWPDTAPASHALRQGTALIMGTSWSDDSLYRADSQLAMHGQATPDWLDPADQLAEIAEALALDGPRLSVDTACSSFAYALATAQALIHAGQARRAVVAGLNVFLPPQLFLGFSQLRALSADARLKAFAQDANGIVPGEGVAAFLVEPLGEALHAGRRPLGLLRSLGISSDGSEGSVFAPGHRAQVCAYERAYRDVDPASIQYVEAHGTGTPVGDHTELSSLHDFFQPHVGQGRKIPLGSIKPLVGHTLAAAGAASLAKALLMIQHRVVPPHVDVLAHEALADSCFELPKQPSALPAQATPLRVAISSFGFGGANAHAVIEEAPTALVRTVVAARSAGHAQRPNPVKLLNLDIVGQDASLGIGLHAPDWQMALTRGEEPKPHAFPASRAQTADVKNLKGHFLHGECTLDVSGWRMGPRPLSHVDAFKLLITHRTRRLADRLPGWRGSADTAMVVCANLGGERFHEGYRACVAHYEEGRPEAPDLVVDDVATMLPTMLSGYPAQVLDLRAFHQTLSGPSDSFWHSLLAAPHWLAGRCEHLLLGAGHYFNCPVEAQRAATQPWTWGEGYGVLALQRAPADLAPNPSAVARLHAIVQAGDEVRDARRARALLGCAADSGHSDFVELCPQQQSDLGVAQRRAGFLGEACGMETILAALASGQDHAWIELRKRGTPVAWLFIDRIQVSQPVNQPVSEPPAQMPFSVHFSMHSSEPEAEAVAPPQQQAEATPASIAQPAPVTAPAPVAESIAAPGHWTSPLADTLLRALQLRARIVDRLQRAERPDEASRGTPLSVRRRDPRNVLLRQIERQADGWGAMAIVDEGHPYYFDHALDHVPGILLLEAALQLTEVALADLGQGAHQPCSLGVRFRRYTEKQEPIRLSCQQDSTQRFTVRIEQAGQCVCEVEVGTTEAVQRPHSPVAAATTGLPEPKWLHKARPENRLVHELELRGGALGVVTADLPNTHALSDGPAGSLSMLYFLEVARQCFMLVAHGKLAVPLGTPMNLVDLRFSLNAPIPRHGRLWLSPSFSPVEWTGTTRTSKVTMQLCDANGAFGQASIVSQAIAPEAYAAQRQTETA